MALIELDDLAAGHMPGVEPYVGAYMAQVAVICFEDSNHVSGVALEVEGTFREQVEVQWRPLQNPQQARRSWDPDEATEQGACGVAALLIDGLTEYTIVERAVRLIGTPRRSMGFDYWLDRKGTSRDDPRRLGGSRLEVSGIRRGSRKDVAERVRRKTRQTTQSDSLQIPAYVAVVEFGLPHATVSRRWTT